MQEEIKVGQAVIFDGMVWGMVEEVFEDGLLVIDQDGGDHLIDFGRIHAVL